jgi:hypothetical protein
MNKFLICTLLASLTAVPALAQPVVAPPAGAMAAPSTNAAIAHHDRMVARRAARHGNFHKAAVASHAANVAASQAAAPQ